jgi:hypothetical protein
MDALITFRCPETGMDVHTALPKQENPEKRAYEGVVCPACTRLHFINTYNGKLLGWDK